MAEFHGVPSEWIKNTIDMTLTELHAIEPGIDPGDAWYAEKYTRPVQAEKWRRLLSSARQRLVRALPSMMDFERLTLGTTYDEAFGRPSSTIHYRAGADPVGHSEEGAVVVEGTKISMIGMCIMRRIYDALGKPAVPQLEQIARVLDANREPSRLMELLNVRSTLVVGDFVSARGYLGQVMEECTSGFGYRSVRVEFLAERPLPALAADWFRVRDVVLVFAKRDIVEKVRVTVKDPTADVSDDILRESVRSAWELKRRIQSNASAL